MITPRIHRQYGVLLCCGLISMQSLAYVVTINTGTRAVYLRVGDGVRIGNNYASGGTMATGGAISLAQVSVPAASVGNGVPQPMLGNARLTSDYDDFLFCTAGQIYIGGFFRLPNNANQNASLRVNAPANLVNATGDTIPISQISWTMSGSGDAPPHPIANGNFNGGLQTLASNFLRNTWRETCHSFRYANTTIPAAGTYNVRVLYTLSSP
ncbi:MAG: hypothetical protein VXW65_07490 [Pseudomonadota bacterium]|nr:hypothetical protein [Pseudomonadota bacterium]